VVTNYRSRSCSTWRVCTSSSTGPIALPNCSLPIRERIQNLIEPEILLDALTPQLGGVVKSL
jgi:hypothetical protein